MRAEPVPGYIHRMHEKMGENRTYAQFLPNTSRIDYLSAMHYTHAFVSVVERAAGIEVPPRAEYIRVITSELNRISSHLVWFGAFLLDFGGFTPLLLAFDDREKILDLLEGDHRRAADLLLLPLRRAVQRRRRGVRRRARARLSPTCVRGWRSTATLVTGKHHPHEAAGGHRTDQRRDVPQIWRERPGHPRRGHRL